MPTDRHSRHRLSVRVPAPRPQRPGVAGQNQAASDAADQAHCEDGAISATFEQAGIGLVHTALDGRWLRVNAKFCELVGYARLEVLKRTIADLTYPPDFAGEKDLLHPLTTGNVATVTFEKRFVRKDGSLIWASVTATLMRDSQGMPMCIIGVIEDISSRKAVEAALSVQTMALRQTQAQASEQARYLEAAIDSIADAVTIFDASGQSIYLNRTFCRAMGVANGTQLFDLLKFSDALHLRDLDGRLLMRDEWPLLRCLRGETLAGSHTADVQFSSPLGENYIISVSGGPILDGDGQIMGAVQIGRDVTIQRQMERKRQEALNAIFDLGALLLTSPIPDPAALCASLLNQILFIFPVHSAAIIQFAAADEPWNILAASGFQPEQADWMRRAHLLSQQIPVAALQERLLQGETVIVDWQGGEAEGNGGEAEHFHWVQGSQWMPVQRGQALGIAQTLVVPLMTSDHFVEFLCLNLGTDQRPFTPYEQSLIEGLARFGAMVLNHDRLLREREEGRARLLALEEATERMDNFLGVASHELRTPMTSLQGNLQILRRRLGALAREPATTPSALVAQLDGLRPLLDAGESALRRLNRLIDDLLEVTRIRAGKLQVRHVGFDLAMLVRNTVAELQARWPDRRLVMDVPAHSVPVVSDSDRVQQVVENFLTNALKYAPVSEPIAISLVEHDGDVRVAVRDHGPGLTPAQQQRIWERFYRVEGVEWVDGSGVGLGLGLFIAQSIITHLGGRLGVESTPGQGATFWFTLPHSARQE